ncbi:MAG: multiheme c-type cytochrome, partial [bacterium]
MGKAIFSLVLFFGGVCTLPAQEASQSSEINTCVSCHLEIGDELALPVEGMKEDVHARQGLSCVDCHGGDPTAGQDGDPDASMDPAKGYIGAPVRSQIPQFCGRCHSDPNYMRRFNPRVATDQLDRYKTSVHGQRLQQGDAKVATCIDCHGVHGIHGAKDARSSVYPLNIPET